MSQFVFQRSGNQWKLVPLAGATKPQFDVTTDTSLNTSRVLAGRGTCTDALNALLGAASGYNHIQAAPAVLWVVNHGLNLPILPDITVTDAAGKKILVDASFVDPNTCHVGPFVVATAGAARCG